MYPTHPPPSIDNLPPRTYNEPSEEDDVKTIPHQEFARIVEECEEILRTSFGITIMAPEAPSPLAVQLTALNSALDLIDVKVEIPPTPRAKRDRLSAKTLEEMTVRCAEVFRRHGIQDFYYNETLNGIRADLVDVLEAQGFACAEHHNPTPWDAARKRCGIEIGPEPKE